MKPSVSSSSMRWLPARGDAPLRLDGGELRARRRGAHRRGAGAGRVEDDGHGLEVYRVGGEHGDRLDAIGEPTTEELTPAEELAPAGSKATAASPMATS
jgi:hypothetical protein